jgi:hypothetical protein
MKLLRSLAPVVAAVLFFARGVVAAEGDVKEIDSLQALADVAATSGNNVRMKPGVYRLSDYLNDNIIAAVRKEASVDPKVRSPVWMIRFSGSNNRFDFRDVVIEIDTTLYARLPRGYTRCLFIPGDNNTIDGLTVRNTGPNKGSNGNIFSVWGNGNTVENVTLNVSGSNPYGYGDLLGKGGPNLVSTQKQSGFMLAGHDNTVRRCKVISRAFGHCFYIQAPAGITTDNIRIEDCYAEGEMRPTSEMLRDTSGPAFDLGFRSVYENRDGRYMITPGYMKALCEDGFRNYGGVGKVTLLNCTAVNTRAGFEIAGTDEATSRTVIENGTALGCERGYLIGSNTTVHNSRGDAKYGPLLYLRGGRNADVELQLTGEGSNFTVHALATIAGEDHRVRFFTNDRELRAPAVPVMLGYGMPDSAEMSAPIKPAATKNVTVINELSRMTVIRSAQAADCRVETSGRIVTDDEMHQLRPTTAPASQPATQPK